MIEVKDYFEKIKNDNSKILLWIAGSDEQPVAMRTLIKEVFTFDGTIAGVGITPKLDCDYMEYIPMNQIIKFTMVPEDMVDEFFEKAEKLPAGKPDKKVKK